MTKTISFLNHGKQQQQNKRTTVTEIFIIHK